MDQEVKTKWVEALRSGQYKQAKGALCSPRGFCCLGVLLETLNVPREFEPANMLVDVYRPTDDEAVTSYLPTKLAVKIGVNLAFQGKLAALNDDGLPFNAIADYIEENL